MAVEDLVPEFLRYPVHRTCGQRGVVERPRTVTWCVPGETELYCEHCGLIIHPLYEKHDVIELEELF